MVLGAQTPGPSKPLGKNVTVTLPGSRPDTFESPSEYEDGSLNVKWLEKEDAVSMRNHLDNRYRLFPAVRQLDVTSDRKFSRS